jgi:hypothetical protein
MNLERKRVLLWLRILTASLLICLPVISSYANIIKTFAGFGEILEETALTPFPLNGELVYTDPDPAQNNRLSLDAVISLYLEISSADFFLLNIPYMPPPSRPDLGPEISIEEIDEMIFIDLLAYSDFEFSNGELTSAETWSMEDNSLSFLSRPGSNPFNGSIEWTRVPEPSTLLLLGAGMMAWYLGRQEKVRNRLLR